MKTGIFPTISLLILISTPVAWAQAAPAVQLDAVPLGPLVTTGGGHYQMTPLITPDGLFTVVPASKGSRVQAYVNGVPGPVVRNVPSVQANTTTGSGSPVFSPDRKLVAYIVDLEGGQQAVVINSTQSPAYDRVAFLGFAPVGHHFAYVAMRGGGKQNIRYFVVDNGRAGLEYESLQPPVVTFSPDGVHCAYVALSSAGALPPVLQHGLTPQRFRVVLDGVEQKHFEPAGQITFSSDGRHFAYLAGINGLNLTRAVIDGQEGPAYMIVKAVSFSGDGARWAYVAAKPPTKDGFPQQVVVDTGREGPVYGDIQDLIVSRDGGRVAYVGMSAVGNRNQYVVVDNGKPGVAYESCGKLQFSPDGKTLVYTAHAAQGELVVANGEETGPFNTVHPGIAFSEDSRHWAVCVDPHAGGHAVVEDGKIVPLNAAVGPGAPAFQPGAGRLFLQSRNNYNGATVAVEVGAPDDPAGIPSAVVFSPNGQHYARVYTAGSGTSQATDRIAVDGAPASAGAYVNINHVAVSDDGRHLAFIGSGGATGTLTHVVFDGKEGPGYKTIDDLALSPDGRHVAYVAEDAIPYAGHWFVVIDGLVSPAFADVLPMTSWQEGFHRLRFEPDGSLRFLALFDGQLHRCTYSADAFKSLPSLSAAEAATPGLRVLRPFTGTAVQMVLAPDETLYGISVRDGKFHKGTLFQMKTDGAGFTVLHDFFGGDIDGEDPLSLLRAPDGVLYGTFQYKMFRYDPRTQQYSLVHINERELTSGYLSGFGADGSLIGMTGTVSGPSRVFRMAPDGSDFQFVENGPYAKPLRMFKQIVPLKDGSYLAVGMAGGGDTLVKFAKITDAGEVMHKFVNSPTDGTMPEPDLTSDGKGHFYGSTLHGGMSQKGVIYRIDADGSNYQVVYNPDQFTFPRRFAVGDDGTLYAVSREGLATLAPGAAQPTTILPFQNPPDFNYPRTPCLFIHDGTLYGLANKAIYKVTLGGSNPAAPATPTVTIRTVQPAPPPADAILITDPSGQAASTSQPGTPPPSNAPSNAPSNTASNPQDKPDDAMKKANDAADAVKKAQDLANKFHGLFGH